MQIAHVVSLKELEKLVDFCNQHDYKKFSLIQCEIGNCRNDTTGELQIHFSNKQSPLPVFNIVLEVEDSPIMKKLLPRIYKIIRLFEERRA